MDNNSSWTILQLQERDDIVVRTQSEGSFFFVFLRPACWFFPAITNTATGSEGCLLDDLHCWVKRPYLLWGLLLVVLPHNSTSSFFLFLFFHARCAVKASVSATDRPHVIKKIFKKHTSLVKYVLDFVKLIISRISHIAFFKLKTSQLSTAIQSFSCCDCQWKKCISSAISQLVHFLVIVLVSERSVSSAVWLVNWYIF